MQLPNPRSHQHQKQRNQINPSGTLTLTLGPRSQHQQLWKVLRRFCAFLKQNKKEVNQSHVADSEWSLFVVVNSAGKGRGRKRKGSGSEEDYSPMKKMTKPAGRVSSCACVYYMQCWYLTYLAFLSCYCEHQGWEWGLTGTPTALCKFCSLWPDVMFDISANIMFLHQRIT